MNTPDTEWEKEKWVEQVVEDVLLFEGSAYEISHKEVVKSERDRLREIALDELRSDIELTIFQLLTSRDTYWKERVEELELSCVDDRLLGKTDEYLEGYNTSTERWREQRDALLDNLK